MSLYYLNPNRRGERMACRLEQFDDYRVLRRLPRPSEIWCRSMPASDNIIRLAIVDCETLGLDPERHQMIEFAVGILSIDAEIGDVVDVVPPQSWLEDPAEDVPIEIERLTHISNDMLIGRCFPEQAILKAMTGVNAVVAHHAKFDRVFAIKRFPTLANLPWICSMTEVDWPALGYTGGRSINSLLTDAGFFLPDAHRAAADVWATTCLLTSAAPDGRAIAAQMIEAARRPSERLYANGAPFDCKDVLKAAGYRWSPECRAWWTEGDPERILNERCWLKQLSPDIRPRIEQRDWFNRHGELK